MSNDDTTPITNVGPPESFVELSEGFLVGGGRYSLAQLLGQGGMGSVWLAKDERLGQMVALKFVQLQSNPLVLDDLRRETARSLKLTHPNIIRIYDFYESPGEPAFISMEFVDGANLHSLRDAQLNGVFSWNFLKPFIKQLCDALQYAHGENVIHRDLKPSNMMVDAKGRLKLADFGIAAAMSDPLQAYYQRHAASGTITHMSPQQMAGKPATVADDIYAFGATLYDLLTGSTPFQGEDIPAQVQNNLAEPIAIRLAKLKLPNEIPPHVAAMIMACLSKDPEPRPVSARAVADWIGFQGSSMVRGAPISVATVAGRLSSEPKTRRGIVLPSLPAPVAVPLVEKAPVPEAPLISPARQFPVKKILGWASLCALALMLFATLGWLLGKTIFAPKSGAVISSIPDGSASLDPTFQTKTVIDNFVRSAAAQTDGKIIIVGGFETIGSIDSKKIGRLNADGTFDQSFVASADNVLYCVALQEDGKILLGGDLTSINGVSCKSIARLTPDGTVDSTFNLWTDTEGTLRSLLIQPDGKILVAGHFTKFHGVKKNRIARLNSDGSLDETFKAGANNVIWTMAAQDDKKILIGGDFTGVDGGKQNRIARLNTDGGIDKSFEPGTGANGWVYAIALQSDGKIILGGDFTDFNGRPRNRVARLEADGSLDATFTPGAGPDSGIRTIAVQTDQKILLGGVFKYFNDTALNYIARLNVNGSLDQSFEPGAGFNSVVRQLQVQKDGKILAVGTFTNYNGAACSRVVRLKGSSKGKK
ncbi:MAG: protein kinase [Verrucomicrobiota bacterium]